MSFVLKCYALILIYKLTSKTLECAVISNQNLQKTSQAKPKGFGTAKRAVIIGIDGFGGAHFRNATHRFPTLKTFIDKGSYTTRARGVFPISSGPNWGSYLTGMDVLGHGILNNGWKLMNGDPPNETSYSVPPVSGRGRPDTIFTQVKKKDPKLWTAFTFTWKWMRRIAFNNSDIDMWHWGGEDFTCPPNNSARCYSHRDWNSMTAAKETLLKYNTTLTFVQLDLLDAAGHKYCWGCPQYYLALTDVETKITSLIDALKQNNDSNGEPLLKSTLLVIVSDHGGWKKSHGDYDLPFSALIDIPILIRGPGVLKNNSLENIYVSNLDVATTVLNAIGAEKSEFMRGRVLEEIYER